MIQIPLCKTHNLEATGICRDQACAESRLFCPRCKETVHRSHPCYTIHQWDRKFANNDSWGRQQKSLAMFFSALETGAFKIQDIFLATTKFIQKIEKDLAFLYKLPSSLMGRLGKNEFSWAQLRQFNKQGDHMYSTLLSMQKVKNYFETNTQENVMKFIQFSRQKISKPLERAMKKINEQLTKLEGQILNYSLQRSLQQFEASLNNPIAMKQKKGKTLADIDSQLDVKIDQIFTEIIKIEDLSIYERAGDSQKLEKPKGRRIHKETKQIRNSSQIPGSVSKMGIIIENQMIEEANIDQASSRRVVLKAKKQEDGTKNLAKKQIISTINALKLEKSYTKNLKQFIIQQCTEFDYQCLRTLANCFPQLQKINHIWNFEQESLRLEQEQLLFIVQHDMQKCQNDLRTSQELLNIYGRFPNLENITISHIKQFGEKRMQILNKNLKHITLGEYVLSFIEEQIHPYVQDTVLGFGSLITLNLFNIKNINGDFMEKVISKNRQTLSQLWFSQCANFEERVLKAIGGSKIKRCIIEQSERLAHSFEVPATLETLGLSNSIVALEVPICKLPLAKNLKNVTIFESTFTLCEDFGEMLIEELAKNQASQLEYLNVGECKSVNNSCLNLIVKFNNLKALVIDNTAITLGHLVDYEKILCRLQKLGIVGLPVQRMRGEAVQNKNLPADLKYEEVMSGILRKSPSLRCLSLTFQNQFKNVDLNCFSQLKHISFQCNKMSNIQQLKAYITLKKKRLQQMKISIRLY